MSETYALKDAFDAVMGDLAITPAFIGKIYTYQIRYLNKNEEQRKMAETLIAKYKTVENVPAKELLALELASRGTLSKMYAFKETRNEKGELVPPPLRFDILDEVVKRLPGFPIVLHGASSVNQDHIKMINQYGGQMPDAIGIPEDMLREAASMAVCKINVDSDIRIAMTAAIRKHFAENPTHFDPRQYLTPARDLIEEVVAHKIDVVFGTAGHAND
jgi:fructose/tagatose bisphosphate aldolase